LTPRQRNVLTEVVNGLFIVACIGLLMLLVRGYHTLVLILIGVMSVIGALTFTYARRATLEGFSLVVTVR